MITHYVITGMTCGHCVNAVTEEVSGIEGVDPVEVTLEGGAMSVSSESPIDLAAIAAAVDEAGDYTVAQA